MESISLLDDGNKKTAFDGSRQAIDVRVNASAHHGERVPPRQMETNGEFEAAADTLHWDTV
ncbi:hypothetical protein [Mesorhizobium sp. M0140]|uniref:hypothetical protein n=1 Tax=Mesorhizobium sp. M0140 TaxID=2956893 RepID=UPI00333DCDFB